MLAQSGGLGTLTVQGAYSARSGNQVMAVWIPRFSSASANRSVN